MLLVNDVCLHNMLSYKIRIFAISNQYSEMDHILAHELVFCLQSPQKPFAQVKHPSVSNYFNLNIVMWEIFLNKKKIITREIKFLKKIIDFYQSCNSVIWAHISMDWFAVSWFLALFFEPFSGQCEDRWPRFRRLSLCGTGDQRCFKLKWLCSS